MQHDGKGVRATAKDKDGNWIVTVNDNEQDHPEAVHMSMDEVQARWDAAIAKQKRKD